VRAIDKALDGEAGEGYVCLVEGLCRVTALQDAGEPGAEQLVARYRLALDDFAYLYGVARE
jgi:hypothetical protein